MNMRCYKAVLSPLTALFMLLAGFSSPASSGVTITGTRIIFPGAEREATVRTINRGGSPVLVQVWVDDGSKNADINTMTVPFTVTPPVYRIDQGKGQSVRLIYNGMKLPDDRESVYWFNLLEIPAVNEEYQNKDRLELAFRTRIKIFYRPASLTADSTLNAEKLRWTVTRSGKSAGVLVNNPTPYYFNFGRMQVSAGNSVYPLSPGMVAPYSEAVFSPAGNKSLPQNISSIDFDLLNDHGTAIAGKASWHAPEGWSVKFPSADNS